MLRLIVLIAVAFGSLGCTELPPPPGGGTGGTGAGGGVAGGGGSGGAGPGGTGAGPTGGTGGGAGGGGGVGGCTEIIPTAAVDIEPETDGVQEGIAIGRVSCTRMDQGCEPDDDPMDAWAITTCGGEIKVELRWTDVNHDLDLYVLNASLELVGSSTLRDMTKLETVVIGGLTEETELVIEVQAWDTGIAETYNLTVTPQ